MGNGMDRRAFMKSAAAAAVVAGSAALAGCSGGGAAGKLPELPPASPDPDNMFGVDMNINMATIDQWLDRPDVAYRDMRMIHDPADYAAIGGNSELAVGIEGFRIVPLPYLATLQELPVDGAYQGPHLLDVVWDDEGDVAGITERYTQSLQTIEELFPKDKAIFLCCGGAGYASMMRKILIYLGWDESKVYNVGGAWDYVGKRPVVLISYEDDGTERYYLWRADVAYIDFEFYTAS